MRQVEKFLTIAEVSARLRLTSQTVYKMIKNGHVPAIRVGLKWRIPEDKFLHWLQSQESSSDSQTESQSLPKKINRALRILTGKAILIVDDEPAIISWLKDALEPLGINILSADSGNKAIEMVRSYADTIDLIVLDMIMPNGNGLTTYREILKSDLRVPIIFSSGYTENEELAQLRKSNKIAFLQKPFKKDKIVELLVHTFETTSK